MRPSTSSGGESPEERAIRRLHHDDADFRELCDDYRDVLDAFDHATTEAGRRELERLKADLEEEIAGRLNRDLCVGPSN